MPTLTMELPDKVLAALRVGPDDFPIEMRLVAAAAWYEQGKVSQEVAARIAGLNRTDFLLALARMGKDSINYSVFNPAQHILNFSGPWLCIGKFKRGFATQTFYR